MTGVDGQGAASEGLLIRTLRDRVLLLHIAVLPFSLGAGRLLCSTDLGWSDSLVLARPRHVSAPDYIAHWYTHLNGRLPQAFVASLAQSLSSFSPTPESFPFWLFTGLSLGCILLTALLIGSSVSRASRSATSGLIVALFVLAVWGINGVLFENITYHHLAIFLDYTLPTYLTALWFRRTLELASGSPCRLRLLLHASAYLFLSAYVEIFLLTVPILGLLAWAPAQRVGQRPRSFWPRLAALYAALSLAAACVFSFSPGQQKRTALLGVRLPEFSLAAVGRALDRVTSLVPAQYFGLSPRLCTPLYGIALLGLAAFLTVAWRAGRGRPPADSPERTSGRWPGGFAAAAAVLLVAHASSLAPALVVEMPARAAIFPALLLATSVALALLAAGGGARRGRSEGPAGSPGRVGTPPTPARAGPLRLRAPLLLAAAGALAVSMSAAHLRGCVSIQKERRQLFDLRRRIYGYILALHDRTGARAFVLKECDLAPGGQPLEPPWGLSAYFAWARVGRPRVFIDSNYDFPERPQDLEYTVISCRAFLRGPGA